jgi:hypothetical protein
MFLLKLGYESWYFPIVIGGRRKIKGYILALKILYKW